MSSTEVVNRSPELTNWSRSCLVGGCVAHNFTPSSACSRLVTVAPPVQRFDFATLEVPRCPWLVAQGIVFWMMGGLDSRTWAHVWISAPFVVTGLVAALLQSRTLDLLLLGEDTAAALGVDVEASKRLLVLTSAVLTGASVAVAGLVGFVGLVVPHAVRLVLGPGHRTLLPASAIAGATFLIACDLVARTVRPPAEIRLGVVTALCGAPLFLVLLLRNLRERAE